MVLKLSVTLKAKLFVKRGDQNLKTLKFERYQKCN